MRKVVKYHNDINKLKLGKFKEKEIDLLFSLFYKFKNKGTTEEVLTFQELKELSEHTRMDRFINDLISLHDKLLMMIYHKTNERGTIEKFTLFNRYSIDPENKIVIININPYFQYVLNDLLGNYTIFDLQELVNLNGNYAKNLFRLLKQFESTNTYHAKIEDFKELLDIPSTYKMFNIDQKVLKPCMEQLKLYFPNLKLEKVKKGVKVESLKFTWKEKKKEIIEANPPVKYKSTIGEIEHQKYIEQIQEVESIQDKIVEVTKEKISKYEFEKMVQELMDKNNTKDPFSKRGFECQLSLKYSVVEDISVVEESLQQEKKVISIDEYQEILKNHLIHNPSLNIKEFEKEFFKHSHVKGVSIMGDDGAFTSLDYRNILK